MSTRVLLGEPLVQILQHTQVFLAKFVPYLIQTPESQIRGYKPGRFSFNVTGGRCETCMGGGLKVIEMNFLPDVYIECESCQGKRFNRETLRLDTKENPLQMSCK